MANNKLFGDGSNVPEDLKNLSSNITYWSKPNPEAPIQQGLCWESIIPAIFLPCFWPHLLICSPCIVGHTMQKTETILATNLVLTTTSLVLTEGTSTRSISLDKIETITTATQPIEGCSPGSCVQDLNRLVIDDGSFVKSSKGKTLKRFTVIYGHENIEDLKNLILQAKERMAQALTQVMMQQGGVMMQPMMMQPGLYPGQQQQPMLMQPGYPGQPGGLYPVQQQGYPGQQPVVMQQPLQMYPVQSPIQQPVQQQQHAVYHEEEAPKYYEEEPPVPNSNPVEYPQRS
jgi:hypothetical protein